MKKYKIKLEDKAAFLNRLDKFGVAVNKNRIKDNKLEEYFEIEIEGDENIKIVNSILKKAPKIDVLKEHIKRIVKETLKRNI